MTRHFASLSDRAYLPKLLVLIDSLQRHCSEEYTLHVLCLDDYTEKVLYELQSPNVERMYLPNFERAMHMEPVKASRSWQEYCWTCASSLMEYLMPWMDESGVTYLDADLIFFSDPDVMFTELGERSIAIIPHRLIPAKKHLEVNGLFNVGWVTIRNTEAGRQCIQTWARQTREWCFNRVEGDKACGDQKFLDRWPADYGEQCCIIQNIGANVAPWNLGNHRVSAGPCVDGEPVVFFHAHEFRDDRHLTNYELRDEDRRFIYEPYVEQWKAANVKIAEVEQAMSENQAAMQLQSERA